MCSFVPSRAAKTARSPLGARKGAALPRLVFRRTPKFTPQTHPHNHPPYRERSSVLIPQDK